MKIASRQEIERLDRYASQKLHIPEEILMENAGQSAVSVLALEWGEIRGRKFVVCCGVGNNGGDGLVVARHLLSREGIVTVFIIGDPERFSGAAKLNWAILNKLPLAFRLVGKAEEMLPELSEANVIIDALFGTGLDRDITGLAAQVIRLINEQGKRVLSLDIPSGVNGDTGEIMGCAIRADWTVAFGLPKRGNILYPGFELCGMLLLAPISFPPFLQKTEEIKVALNDNIKLPRRDRSAHKGSVGNCMVIAGSRSYFGAPLFCALSFLKAGGGYVRLALPKSLLYPLASVGSEIVFLPQEETAAGSIAGSNREDLIRLAEKMDSVIIGPGLSTHPETAGLTRDLAVAIEKPLVIDADALFALAADPAILRKRKIPAVLTPHLGEMSRLIGRPAVEWSHNKIAILQECCDRWGVIIVLKGPHSLIGYPDGRVFVNLSGNPGMATAGAGDVLPGAIAAMYGLGLAWEEAVRKGVNIHGLAGDLAALDKGEDGMTARDILEFLPAALRGDRQDIPPVPEQKYWIRLAL